MRNEQWTFGYNFSVFSQVKTFLNGLNYHGYVYFKFKKTKLSEIPELPHVWIHYQCRNPEMNLKSIKPSYHIMQVEIVSVLPSGIVFNLFDLISGILDKIDRTIILLLRLPSNQEKGSGAFWPLLNFIFYSRQSRVSFSFLFCLNLWVMVCAVTLFNFILSMFCRLFMSNRRKQLSYSWSMELIWTVEHLMVNLH